MSERADIFENDFDVSDFTPGKPPAGPPAEAIRKVAQTSAFRSREPERQGEQETPTARNRRERRIYRTGRDAQFSCKAHPDVVDEFYAITEANGWVMGETLERAVAALRSELKERR